MIEKVKVTVEQAREIEEIRDADYAINIHGFNKRPDKAIATMTTAQIARALYIGYEVEEEYEVGGWVACEYEDGIWIVQIERIEGKKVFAHWENDRLDWNRICDIRHATPEEIKAEKERRVWAGIGREVGIFMYGDSGRHKNGGMVSDLGYLTSCYEHGELKGFYPAESFIEFGGGER